MMLRLPMFACLYMIPGAVAEISRCRGWFLILMFNLLFGWTVIGWFVALWLATTGTRAVRAS